jgi:hypothetical protein
MPQPVQQGDGQEQIHLKKVYRGILVVKYENAMP